MKGIRKTKLIIYFLITVCVLLFSACIYLDYTMILHYLDQKYMPTKEYVIYVLLGVGNHQSEQSRRFVQNKILSAFYSYGMNITEEIYDMINFTYDFNTWDFTKDVHQSIKDKFKTKTQDIIIKNIMNIIILFEIYT